MNYKIIYQDSSILAVDKPQGLATATGKEENLCEILFSKFNYLKNVKGYKKNEGGLLNRLDNETGGLVLFAKHNSAFEYYSMMMKNEKIEKIYNAVVSGKPDALNGVINIPIGHDLKNKKKMIVIHKKTKYRGRRQKALTEWKLIDTYGKFSLLEIIIKKGVRHQIRVHLKYLGNPIIGDKLYGNDFYNNIYPYHLLYCRGIIIYNSTDKKIEINTEVPFLKCIPLHYNYPFKA